LGDWVILIWDLGFLKELQAEMSWPEGMFDNSPPIHWRGKRRRAQYRALKGRKKSAEIPISRSGDIRFDLGK
jgi:hypothetical protein